MMLCDPISVYIVLDLGIGWLHLTIITGIFQTYTFRLISKVSALNAFRVVGAFSRFTKQSMPCQIHL